MIHSRSLADVPGRAAVSVSPQILGLTLSEPEADAWMYLGALFALGDAERHNRIDETRDLIEHCAGDEAAATYSQLRRCGTLTTDCSERLKSAAEMWITQAQPTRLYDILSATADAALAQSELRGRLFYHWAKDQVHRESVATTHCKSPIEEALALELVRRGFAVLPPVDVGFVRGYVADPSTPAVLSMQHDFGKYRVDFFVTVPGSAAALVVECDGHDFHEKTKQQAARDKQRDRWFLSKGWPTMRFTGSEIHYRVERCADEVMTQVGTLAR